MTDKGHPRAALRRELRASADALSAVLAAASRAPQEPLDALTESLEARCVLEEQWLLPALDEAGERASAVRFGFEIEQLREALATLDVTPPSAPERARGLQLLEWMAVLHVGSVDARLFETEGVDLERLAAQLATARERRAAAAAGEPAAENEEGDPVGRPPR